MSRLEKYKQESDVENSEDIFYIIQPPKYQCTNINDLLNNLKITQQNLELAKDSILTQSRQDVSTAIGDAEYHLIEVSDLENFRGVIEELREWGESWKKLAKLAIEISDISIEELVDKYIDL